MTDFVMLYRSTPETYNETMGTPEKMQASMVRWNAWFDEMKKKGQLKSIGLPLHRTGKVVRGRKKSVTDGPFAETKEVVGGFSIIDARDETHAAEIAAGCPILEGGGSVEVRPVKALP